MARTLLLGSTGFIGKAVAAELEKRGLDCVGLGSRDLDLTRPESSGKLAALVDEGTTVVLASRVARSTDPWRQFSGDMAILTHAAGALARRRAKLCVFASSTSVYGNAATDLDVTEETPVAPQSLYGTAKYLGERLLSHACAAAGTPLLIARPSMVYGPGDAAQSYGPSRFIRSALDAGEAAMHGDGRELRDNVYVDDLARILVDLSRLGARGVFNVGCGEPRSFVDLVRELERVSGRTIKTVHLPRSGPQTDQRLNVGKLLRALPGLRFTSFAAGLEKAYAAAALEPRKAP